MKDQHSHTELHTKYHHHFSDHSLDAQRPPKGQRSPLLIPEQSRLTAELSGTESCAESNGFTAFLHHWMFWGSITPFQSLLSALDYGTLEESISWIKNAGPRAWIHHFHPGIAPQRTVKFSCFGKVGLERISCHWQAALFLCCKCKWSRVPTFTPLAI